MRIIATILLIAAVCIPGATSAQKPAEKTKPAKPPVVSGAVVDSSDRTSIYVTFDVPVPKDSDVPPADSWLIYEKVQDGKDAPPHIQRLEVSSLDKSGLATSYTLLLKLKDPVSKNAKALDMTITAETYILHLPAATLPAGQEDAAKQQFAASTGKSDSDIYFNGSYAAAAGTSAVYNVDSFAGYMEGIQRKKAYYGELGLYGQLKTTQSASINPNSFQVYGVYQRLVSNSTHWNAQFQIPYINYRFAGWEFDLSGKQVNFVTSPILTMPIRLSKAKLGPINPGFSVPHIVLSLGPEFVDVEKNALAPTGTWHTRGLLAASFSSGYKPPEPRKLFESVQLTSAYQVRLPSAPEIFYDPKFAVTNKTTGKTTIPPMLGTQPRHYVDTKFSYNLVKWVSATFENTYGSLPPSFNKTDATYTLGLCFTLKQTSYARYSILRP